MNYNLDNSGISLPVFSSRTNVTLHTIFVTLKMIKKVMTSLNLSQVSRPDCIPVVVFKKCESEVLYILAELFNMCLKESSFPDCWKFSLVVPIFKNVWERSTANSCHPASILYESSKVFEKLENNWLLDHVEKCSLFLISSMVLGLLNHLQIF